MKKILPAAILLLLGIAVWLVFHKTAKTLPLYVVPEEKVPIAAPAEPLHEAFKLAAEINLEHLGLKNIYIREMPILLKQKKRLPVKAYAELAVQKEKFFRLSVSHRLTGKEMDIGSNSDIFWFWSKRGTPPGPFFSRHEDLEKTDLRTALNPNWMIESLGMCPIPTEGRAVKKKESWGILQDRRGPIGEAVTVMTLLDPIRKTVSGRYLYDGSGSLIVSSEYQGYRNGLPLKMLIIWYEEEISLDWDMSGAVTNVQLNSELWKMPELGRKIDLSK